MPLTNSEQASAEAMDRIVNHRPSPEANSYRAGYHHAYEAAIQHVRQGRTVADMEAHGDRIMDWRESSARENAGFVEPPTMEDKP